MSVNPDPREDILVRLLAIAGSTPGVKSAARHDLNINENELPSVTILDGDEQLSHLEQDRKTRDGRGPQQMDMTPHLVIDASGLTGAGTTLNEIRGQLIKLVTSDEVLLGLVGTTGFIRAVAATNSYAWGREIYGKMAVAFMFTYVLRPSQL